MKYESTKRTRNAALSAKIEMEAQRDLWVKEALSKKTLSYGESYLKQAPKLLSSSYAEETKAVLSLTNEHIRPLSEWKPQGKSPCTQYISLCEHLFARYKVPAFLWSVFAQGHDQSIRVVLAVAKGESLFKVLEREKFPVSLTRKQCHAFLQHPKSYNFVQALRHTQVTTIGGSEFFYETWVNSRGKSISSEKEESFWTTVYAWFARHSVSHTLIRPLLDYLLFRFSTDANFSMRGRSPSALLEAMDEWHTELAAQKSYTELAYIFKPSGFRGAVFEEARKEGGVEVQDLWEVYEILKAKDLHKEGKVMNHCVYGYRSSISRGATSIWVLKRISDWPGVFDEGGSQLTIEVSNRSRAIVQARGKYNRKPLAKELHFLRLWARQENLTVSSWL